MNLPRSIPTTTTPSCPLPIRVTGYSSGLSLPIGVMRVDRVDHVDPERPRSSGHGGRGGAAYAAWSRCTARTPGGSARRTAATSARPSPSRTTCGTAWPWRCSSSTTMSSRCARYSATRASTLLRSTRRSVRPSSSARCRSTRRKLHACLATKNSVYSPARARFRRATRGEETSIKHGKAGFKTERCGLRV